MNNNQQSRVEQLAKEMNLDTAFPIKEVLNLLIRATEILLYKKDYDGPDYEEMGHAVKSAKEILDNLKAGFLAASTGASASHPLQENRGSWIKVSDYLPEIIDRKSTPKHVRYLKKRWKGEPYIAKAVAFYFPDRFKTVEWEDWDDYNEKDFPYTENDADNGCVWLRAGWYIDIDCQKCEGHWSAPIEVIEWLSETPQEEDKRFSLEEVLSVLNENYEAAKRGVALFKDDPLDKIKYETIVTEYDDLISIFKHKK